MEHKKALVTGCAGFIGSHLTDKLLDNGYYVIGIDCFTDYYPRKIKEANLEKALENANFKLIIKDILDIDEFPKVDYVFHEAAQAGVRTSWGKTFEIYARNNILATQKLLEFYKDSDIKKFVYASSSSVYGDVSNLPMKEESLLNPLSPYGVTKLAAENLCYLYYKNYNFPIVSLRYFTVYGPRQRPDMAFNKFVRNLINGKEIMIYGNGEQTRDFTYIDDVVRATILAAENDGVGEVLNIGGGSRISINKVISILEEITGKEAKIKYIEKQRGDVMHTYADVNKAKRLLGWNAKVNIKDGLKKYVEWVINRDGGNIY
ncbi:MAG TPA: NAD-dependent epimerase/dehydratase family protein [Archaeoglobaceae archaeon]|nr:NAD-dependent epimerase/dehydratase family protein [Archaeoglobaceae archaeon]